MKKSFLKNHEFRFNSTNEIFNMYQIHVKDL